MGYRVPTIIIDEKMKANKRGHASSLVGLPYTPAYRSPYPALRLLSSVQDASEYAFTKCGVKPQPLL